MKRLLITNDDGMEADGLIRLVRAAKAFGEVWVVAPDGQRSASSHSLTLRDPMKVLPYDFPVDGVKSWSCSGTPADCVRVGIHFILHEKPDIVLSGINYGYNSATDIQYSGTCGAAFEGAFQGAHSIAVSEQACPCHEVTDRYLSELLEELIATPLPYGTIYNVNFPGCPLSECGGVLRNRTVSRSMFYADAYRVRQKLPGGGHMVQVDGNYQEKAEEETDMHALIHHYVSVGTVNNVGVIQTSANR
ncbi:MAG: 5'/3'-nucleotidase SurE [Eubacterium sp.]|nr:5'/3'-nucleotidase SurE [Eubacterium sp.]